MTGSMPFTIRFIKGLKNNIDVIQLPVGQEILPWKAKD